MTIQPTEYKILKPQPGFQTEALSTKADIAILGSGAGVGKTSALLLEFLRHIKQKGWGGVIFRRLYTQIGNEGGLWDTSRMMYQNLHPEIRPEFIEGRKLIRFPSGAKLSFAHLNQESDVNQWQGAQIKFLAFDELTHFEASQFFYMLSRNRGAGVKIDSYCRATCNPAGHGWLKDFISWWLYPHDYADESLSDYPIPERAGKLRYLIRSMNKNFWGDSREECYESLPTEVKKTADNKDGASIEDAKSVTFIPGKLDDNKILLESDPGYKGNLLQLDEEEQEQLLKGRWRSIGSDARIMYNQRAVEDLFTNSFVEEGENFMTCDIAMEGVDLFVIVHWSGWRAENIYFYPKSKGDGIIRIIESTSEKHSVPRRNIAFDAGGVGNYLKGFLRNSFDFLGNAAPIPIEGSKQNYLNLRTQCYYELRQYVNDYGMFINATGKLKEIISEELRAILKAETKADGKLRIISTDEIKALIKRSPDFASAISMRVALALTRRYERAPATSF